MTMREMTAGEKHSWYRLFQWPCGHGQEYLTGPRGGMMQNVECPTCHMKMNIIDPDSPMIAVASPKSGGGYVRAADFGVGQVIFEPEGYKSPPDPDVPAKVKGWWKWNSLTFMARLRSYLPEQFTKR